LTFQSVTESLFILGSRVADYYGKKKDKSLIPRGSRIESFVSELINNLDQLYRAGFYEGSIKLQHGIIVRIRVRAVKKLALLKKCGKQRKTCIEKQGETVSFIVSNPPACLQLKPSTKKKIHMEVIFTYVQS